jgi:hypothetical protein
MSVSTGRRAAAELAAWAALGALVAFDALCLISSIVFLLVVLGPVTWLVGVRLARRTAEPAARWGAALGAAAFPLFLAYTNRHGPGTYCHPIGTPQFPGTECADEWDPRPWLAIGVALVLAAPAGFLLTRRRKPAATGPVSGGGRRA